MRLSGNKINHLAHIIAQNITHEPSIRCLRDKNDIRLRVKIIITDAVRFENELDRTVRRMLNSLQRTPPEGSREWEVLYEKYYTEERNRRRQANRDTIRRMN